MPYIFPMYNFKNSKLCLDTRIIPLNNENYEYLCYIKKLYDII